MPGQIAKIAHVDPQLANLAPAADGDRVVDHFANLQLARLDEAMHAKTAEREPRPDQRYEQQRKQRHCQLAEQTPVGNLSSSGERHDERD
jgi:hypothetical protein